nr:putative zinc finger, CCHC-type [Tanacetum cinerariifolium]
VENQLNRKIKIVRSDRGGEYYGKHSDLGKSPRPFSLYFQENGIVNQFTMPCTPQQNGVAERRNRTLNGYSAKSDERIIDLNEKLMNAPNQELSIPLYKENTTIVPSDEVVDIPVVDAPLHDENLNPPIIQQPLRRSERTKRLVVHDDFITYLNKDDYDLSKVKDPISYKDAINSNQSTQWLEAMNDELKSMKIIDVWELIELPNGIKLCPKNKLEQEETRLKPYASVVGSLTYAQVCTRPAIAYNTGMLGRYQFNRGKEHWKATKKVLRYPQGTKNSMLTYQKIDNLEVVGYSDSDFAKCKDSSRSTSGYIFMLSGGPISWRSHKQELTTTYTIMAEYVACYHATSHAILLRNLISGLNVIVSISRP